MSLYKGLNKGFLNVLYKNIFWIYCIQNIFSDFQIFCSMVFIGDFLKGSVEKSFCTRVYAMGCTRVYAMGCTRVCNPDIQSGHTIRTYNPDIDLWSNTPTFIDIEKWVGHWVIGLFCNSFVNCKKRIVIGWFRSTSSGSHSTRNASIHYNDSFDMCPFIFRLFLRTYLSQTSLRPSS